MIFSCPFFIYLDEQREYYGLPLHGIASFKIGIDAGGPLVTGDTRTFDPDPLREKMSIEFLKKNVPQVSFRNGLTYIYLMSNK